MSKDKKLDFNNQRFFIGIDVHKNQWTVSIRSNQMFLKRFSMNPCPEELSRYLKRYYPGGKYFSVYEAGFCGYWIHRKLIELGIDNKVVHGADVPTTHKEKDRKTDPVDSNKLARELENGNLKSIYIPDEFDQHLRSLCRLRYRIVQNMTRVKNRIKGYLHFNGIPIPPHREISRWSSKFIKWLKEIEFTDSTGKEYLNVCIEELESHRERLLSVIKSLRSYCLEHNIMEKLVLFYSVPGIGFTTAITYYTELEDINRFSTLDETLSYIGLVPSLSSSGDKKKDRGLTNRRNRYLRYLIIEASWVAIRKDPVLLNKYIELSRRMKKQEAIIRIAKKLVNRIRYVWKNQKPYVIGVIE